MLWLLLLLRDRRGIDRGLTQAPKLSRLRAALACPALCLADLWPRIAFLKPTLQPASPSHQAKAIWKGRRRRARSRPSKKAIRGMREDRATPVVKDLALICPRKS